MAEAAGMSSPGGGSVSLSNGLGSSGNPSPASSSPVMHGSPPGSRASPIPDSLGSSIVRINDNSTQVTGMASGVNSVGNLEDMQFSLINSLSSMNSGEIQNIVLELMAEKGKLQEYVMYLDEQNKKQQEMVQKFHTQRQQELADIEEKKEKARTLVMSLKEQVKSLKSENEQLETEKQQLAQVLEAVNQELTEKMVVDEVKYQDESTSIHNDELSLAAEAATQTASQNPGITLDVSPSPSVAIREEQNVLPAASSTTQTEGMEFSDSEEARPILDSIQRENIKMKEMVDRMRATVEQLQEANTRLGAEKRDLIALNNELSLKVSNFSVANVGYVLVNDETADEAVSEIRMGASVSSHFHFPSQDEEVQTSLEQVAVHDVAEAKEMIEHTAQTSIAVVPADEVEEKLQKQNQTIENLQKTIADQEKKIEALADDVKTHLTRLDYANQVRLGLQKDIEQQQNENRTLRARLEAVSKELQATEQSHVENVTKLTSARKSPTQDVDDVNALQQQRDSLAASNFGLKQANEELKRQVTSLVVEMDAKDKELESLQKKQKEDSQRLATSQQDIGQRLTAFEKERLEKNRQITNLTQELRQLESSLKAQVQQKLVKDQDSESLTKEYQDLLHDHHKVIQERESARHKEQEISKKFAELYQEHQQLKTDHKGFEEQFLGMMDNTQKMEAELSKLKELNAKLQQDVEIVPALQAQAQVFEADFNAERRCREEAVTKQNEYKEQIEGYEKHIAELNVIIRQHTGQQGPAGNPTWFRWFNRGGTPGRDEPDRQRGQQGQAIQGQGQGVAGAAWAQPDQQAQLGYHYQYPQQQQVPQQPQQTPQEQQQRLQHQQQLVQQQQLQQLQQIKQQQHIQQQHMQQQQQHQQKQPAETGLGCPHCGERYPDRDSLQVHLIDCDGF